MVSLGQFKNYFDAVMKVDKIYPFGATLAQVARKIRNPDVTIDELADLIKRDASFASEIIRTSNSAFYASSTQTNSLFEAMMKVGLREIVRLLGLSLSRSMTARDLTAYKITADEFWKSTVAAAIVCEGVSRLMNIEKDEAYLAGLLHNIGLIVLDQVLRDSGQSVSWDRNQMLYDWEASVFGFSHATAGAALLRKWEFPEPVVAAVEQQWAPFEVGVPTMADCLRASRIILLPLGSTVDKTRLESPGALQFFETKKLDTTLLWVIAEDAQSKCDKIFSSYKSK